MKKQTSLDIALACLLLLTQSACATTEPEPSAVSERLIKGPSGYTVDWGLPYTGYYWVPQETADNIRAASDACGAPPSVFIYHHIPRPPWFSYFGLKFDEGASEAQKACVVSRLRAVPALTIYPKGK